MLAVEDLDITEFEKLRQKYKDDKKSVKEDVKTRQKRKEEEAAEEEEKS